MRKNVADENKMLGDLLPRKEKDWMAVDKDQIYDQETIFDYIDGAGEVYRSYNFKTLLARHYVREGQPDIYADIFDMGSAKDAFGVFSHDLEGEDCGIGQGSTYKGGLLSFWKACYFVSLYAEDETVESKEALLDLGRKIETAIGEDGEYPEIISLFPREHLDEKSIRYFHTHLILNYHFFVADENILLLDRKTEASLGVYTDKEEKSYLLLVLYPEASKAAEAFSSFHKAYMPDAGRLPAVQTEDGKWTAARIQGNLLAVVFEAPAEELAMQLISLVKKVR